MKLLTNLATGRSIDLSDPKSMLADLIKQSGGLPDFARKALIESGAMAEADVDDAEKEAGK